MTETELKARYRNKLKKIVVEVWNGQKWIYVKTLGDPLKEFRQECLDKVSLSSPTKEEKNPDKFAQSPLKDTLEIDTLIRKPTPEEIKQLFELTKE